MKDFRISNFIRKINKLPARSFLGIGCCNEVIDVIPECIDETLLLKDVPTPNKKNYYRFNLIFFFNV